MYRSCYSLKQSLCLHFFYQAVIRAKELILQFFRIEDSALRDINPDFPVLQNMPIFAGEMVRQCKDIDNVLQQICQHPLKVHYEVESHSVGIVGIGYDDVLT